MSNNKVYDKPIRVGGLQHIVIIDGYIIPLSTAVASGLTYIAIHPYTDTECDMLPNDDSNPSVIDHPYDDF